MSAAVTILAELRALGDPQKAETLATYHKTGREFLGVPAALLDEMARAQRRCLSLEARCTLAQELWASDVHEASVFAAKLLTQARIRPDDEKVWRIIADWATGFDSWALADHAAIAGGKRLEADKTRLDEVETWVQASNLWTRRAALVMTLPFARKPFPNAVEQAARERVLGWAAVLVPDRDRFIQKAIGWWLRELSRREPAMVDAFLDGSGAGLTRSARQEALRLIENPPVRGHGPAGDAPLSGP